MTEKTQITDWRLAYVANKTAVSEKFNPRRASEVAERLDFIKADVPGNFELDFMREGILPDLYYGDNAFKAQELENLHLYYCAEFEYERSDTDDVLVFGGVDTFAEIFLDGEKIGFTENMLHSHEFGLDDLESGKHELLVHILPTAIYARQYALPAMCHGMQYNSDSTEIRKAPYSFGWDIMPRIVSGGLWKPVWVEKRKRTRLEEPFTYTERLVGGAAYMQTAVRVVSDEDFITDFTVSVEFVENGVVRAKTVQKCFSANQRVFTILENARLWYPKNYGEPFLYDVKITLSLRGEVVDEATYRTGVRTVKLRRTSRAGKDGDFCFIVNGQRVFCLGTNWVPTDAFPSRQAEFDDRAMALTNELGCNIVRCWGGNIYPSERLYDFCDEHGIMVWQDFAFGCGHYPDDERLCALTRTEVRKIAVLYRNHPSLICWAGDNECDSFVSKDWGVDHADEGPRSPLDPNDNTLTRKVILQELRNHDGTRPYLPSSPYIDEVAYLQGLPPEDHIWGPRDYFKGDFYKDPICHFASEIGYHGCPSPKSLEKFIPRESLGDMGTASGCYNADWLAHATCMEPTSAEEGNPFAYRIPLMISQIERIFTSKADDLAGFARQSQISQAEANKYFIESFRVKKWRKTGLIWWNVVDGWPQVSDAVVDWYGCKKLAFGYIKRAQQPFDMIVAEPDGGECALFAVNDTQTALSGDFTVRNLANDEVVLSGSFSVSPDESKPVASLPELDHAFYLIEWTTELGGGVNHYACSLGDKWRLEDYLRCMQKAGFDREFEGF